VMSPERLVQRLKGYWSSEVIDAFAKAAVIVKDHGGQDNTQLATIYVQCHVVGLVSLSNVMMECGEHVHKLVQTASGDDGWDRNTREAYQVGVAAEKCQGAAIVLMAPLLVKLRRLGEIIDDRDAVRRFLHYQGVFFWQHVGHMAAAFQGNERVKAASEYPELRTDVALAELTKLAADLYRDAYELSPKE
jgi:hypothetical protein